MLLKYFLIEHRFSSRAHPQSNGMVERRQRMLLNFARLYSDTFSNQNLWHLRLPMCQLLLNSTKSVSRNFTPFFLTYFRHARLPYTTMMNARNNFNEDSNVAGHLRMANRVIKLAHDEVIKQSNKNITWHNHNKVNARTFPVGSKLFVMTSQRDQVSFKLASKWKGPYICVQHLPHHNLLIKPIAGSKIERVHKNLCKPAEFRLEHLRLVDTHPLLQEPVPSQTPSTNSSRSPRPQVDDCQMEADIPIGPRAPSPVPPPQAVNPPAQAGEIPQDFPAIDPPREGRTRAELRRAGVNVPPIRYQRVRLETDLRRERERQQIEAERQEIARRREELEELDPGD